MMKACRGVGGSPPVKKNYLGSSIVGRELGGFMESFVVEVPYWDYDRDKDSD